MCVHCCIQYIFVFLRQKGAYGVVVCVVCCVLCVCVCMCGVCVCVCVCACVCVCVCLCVVCVCVCVCVSYIHLTLPTRGLCSSGCSQYDLKINIVRRCQGNGREEEQVGVNAQRIGDAQ